MALPTLSFVQPRPWLLRMTANKEKGCERGPQDGPNRLGRHLVRRRVPVAGRGLLCQDPRLEGPLGAAEISRSG